MILKRKEKNKKQETLLTKHRLIKKRTSYVAELAVLILPRRHKVSKSSLIARDSRKCYNADSQYPLATQYRNIRYGKKYK